MTVRARLFLLVTLLVGICTLGTAGIMAWLAWSSMLERAKLEAALVTNVLARTASVSEQVDIEVDKIVGDSMLTQAYLAAELVDLGRRGGVDPTEVSRQLGRITARTALDEIWVADELGRTVLSSMDGLDASPEVDAEIASLPAFAPVLAGRQSGATPDALRRGDDGATFRYAAARSVGRPGMVVVGHQPAYADALHQRTGLRRLIGTLLGIGSLDAIWVFDDTMQELASGGMQDGDVIRPDEAERGLASLAMGTGRAQTRLTTDRVSVAAPVLDVDGIPTGATLVRLPTERLKAELRSYLVYGGGVACLMLLVGLGGASWMAGYISQPISHIAKAAKSVEARRFDPARLAPVAARPDELGRLARVFSDMAVEVLDRERQLDALVQARTHELEQKNVQLEAAHRQIDEELQAAQTLQAAILPQSFPQTARYHCHAMMVPARQLAGDFYDFIEVDEHRIGVIIADVSGKGVPAAFFMGISRTLLQAAATEGLSPGVCLARTNDALCRNNPTQLFVTVFYGVLDLRTGEFVYANGGHNPPRLVHKQNGSVSWLPMTGGLVLGALEGMRYAEHRIGLAPGDTLFLYTDGISEAQDPMGEVYTEERLDLSLSDIGLVPVETLTGRITDNVRSFTGDAPLHDDVTCLVLRWLGDGST
jgi:sigma-B regulation protein RsbU (phosphoserine phosphatase)